MAVALGPSFVTVDRLDRRFTGLKKEEQEGRQKKKDEKKRRVGG